MCVVCSLFGPSGPVRRYLSYLTMVVVRKYVLSCLMSFSDDGILWTHLSTPHREHHHIVSVRRFHRNHEDDREDCTTGRAFCRAVNGHRDDGGGIRAPVQSPMRHRPSRCAVVVVLALVLVVVVAVVDIGTRAQVESLDLRALFDERRQGRRHRGRR